MQKVKKKKKSILLFTLALSAVLLTGCGTGVKDKNMDGKDNSANTVTTNPVNNETEPENRPDDKNINNEGEYGTDRIDQTEEITEYHSLDGTNATDTDRRDDNNGVVGDIVTDIATEISDEFR